MSHYKYVCTVCKSDTICPACKMDQSHPLPPASGPVKNAELPPIIVPLESYNVASWCPTLDGSGKPEQVHVVITPATLDERSLLTIAKWTIDEKKLPPHVLRFKSAGELRRFIGALTRHLGDVWPEAFDG